VADQSKQTKQKPCRKHFDKAFLLCADSNNTADSSVFDPEIENYCSFAGLPMSTLGTRCIADRVQ
jgi:hypothetical protein